MLSQQRLLSPQLELMFKHPWRLMALTRVAAHRSLGCNCNKETSCKRHEYRHEREAPLAEAA